jgi:hypothetical protein
MDPILIVILVVVVLLAALFVGGYVASGRRHRAEQATLRARVEEADQHLARAHADDKGWGRSGLEAAAREAFRERHGRDAGTLMLVQVVDRPGTDEDEAVFHADGERLVLGRSGDRWVARK